MGSRGTNILRTGLAVALCALCTGCLIVPVDYHTSESRKNVSEEAKETLKPGETTKEDVFIKLGEPDEVSPDGRCLVYKWEKVKAIWFVGGYGSAAAGTFDRIYSLGLCFDDRGLFLRHDVKKEFTGHPL